jgi:hypothetical protein
MLEQEKANKAKIVGYGLGLVVVLLAVAWKFLAR